MAKKKKPKRNTLAIFLDSILIILGIYIISFYALPTFIPEDERPQDFIILSIGILITIIGVIALRVNLFVKGKKK